MDWSQILQWLTGGAPQAGPAVPGTNPAAGQPGGAGAPANWGQILQFLLQGGQAAAGASYGGSQLDALKQIFNMQTGAAQAARSLQPGNLGTMATQFAAPINKALAYGVTSAADQNTALRGMSQSPGAVASGEATALAPFVNSNLQTGAGLATAADQFSLNRLQPSFQVGGAPDYLSVLNQLGKLGFGSTYSLPTALGNTGP